MNQVVLNAPEHTVQQILIDNFEDYLKDDRRRLSMNDDILKAVNQIRSCRTTQLGVYVVGCKCCGDSRRVPRSCKHRFCSNCGNADTMSWVKKISRKVPDIKHYHFVFTLPAELRSLAKRNSKGFYNLLFSSSQQSVKEVFKNRGNLLPGLISVLHTNGSDLKYHPHVHMIVSAGGFNESKDLIELTEDFLIGQRLLANRFRHIFLSSLQKGVDSGEFILPSRLTEKGCWESYFNKLSCKQWIVNIEAPLKGAEKIIAYVGRYTKKSCISERRILWAGEGKVTLSYKDYKNSKRGEKPLDSSRTFTTTEFLDRLLQHVPLKGFKVVRYYGMYNSVNWKHIPKDKLIDALNIDDELTERQLSTIMEENILTNYRRSMILQTGIDPLYCYHCNVEMSIIEIYYRNYKGEEVIVDYETGDHLVMESG